MHKLRFTGTNIPPAIHTAVVYSVGLCRSCPDCGLLCCPLFRCLYRAGGQNSAGGCSALSLLMENERVAFLASHCAKQRLIRVSRHLRTQLSGTFA